MSFEMIVIRERGRTVVVSGWRAWVLGAAIVLAAWGALAVAAFVMVGVAVTIGAILLLLVPAAAILMLFQAIARRWRRAASP